LDPNQNPIPLRTKEMMLGRKRHEIFDPAPSQQKGLALIVGSRGCDYGCKFCLSSEMFPSDKGKRTRYRDVSNIIDEIKDCQKRFGTNALFFVDLNFYGGNKERISELCDALSKTGINWYAMSRVDASSETFEHMKRGGCIKVGLGIESLVKPLKNGVKMSKEKWQKFVKSRIESLRDIGILTKGYFILNDQGETRQDLEEEESAILESGCDDIRMSYMVYSPGTPIFKRLVQEGNLVTDNLTQFSTDYPVIRNPDMTPEELLKKRKGIYRNFFTSPQYKERVKKNITRFPNLNQAYLEFNNVVTQSLGAGFID
ncbi:MAG: B12-binding domain-containing radical SAM protein, partial [Promethearchaeota archaeon]